VALDDGRGDTAVLDADVTVILSGDRATILLAAPTPAPPGRGRHGPDQPADLRAWGQPADFPSPDQPVDLGDPDQPADFGDPDQPADLGQQAPAPPPDDPPEGVDVPLAEAVTAALAAAHAFLDERAAQASATDAGPGGAWRIADLADGAHRVAARLRAALGGVDLRLPAIRPPHPPARPVGPVRRADGGWALVALAPLGRLRADQALRVAELAGPGGLRITPWRSVVLVDPAPDAADALAAAGLGVHADSEWYQLSCCTGRPGCASARADVRADARVFLRPGQRVHVSGCDRRCGRPADTQVDVLATDHGYRVTVVGGRGA
jgi:hypothetical protein